VTNHKRFDKGLFAGAFLAAAAVLAGITLTGVNLQYFLQPSGVLIVIGGAASVMLLTTPIGALTNALKRVASLASSNDVDREALLEEIIRFSRLFRRGTPAEFEASIPEAPDGFLREGLMLGLDIPDRHELQLTLEAELRLRERQGETDARILETAGAFAPTIGIVGTVVGLIEVLRQFSNVQSVGHGVGTAFVSTVYGLAAANFVLLPLAHRIRLRVAQTFETEEMILEGILCIYARLHPALIRQRLTPYLGRSYASESARTKPASAHAPNKVNAAAAG